MVAVARIRFGAKGFCVVVSAAAPRRRWTHDDQPGRGHGIAQILARRLPRTSVRNWLRDNEVGPKALPRDLSAAQVGGAVRAVQD
jgi:hypothetical protein